MEENLAVQRESILAEHSEPMEELCKVLNRVIAKAINSRNEFLTFAGKAESQSLFDLCMQVKSRRDEFALNIQRRVTALGHEPATDENFVGWIHHLWARTRLTVEADSDYVIASETVREEESMILALTDAMKEVELPADIHAAFEAEANYSQELHRTMEAIKFNLKPDKYIDLNRDND